MLGDQGHASLVILGGEGLSSERRAGEAGLLALLGTTLISPDLCHFSQISSFHAFPLGGEIELFCLGVGRGFQAP